MTRAGALTALLLLTACAPSSDGVTLVRSVGPGNEVPSAERALTLFQSVCVASGGRHDAMLTALRQQNVFLETGTGIYFHTEYDASFKPVLDEERQACSFVTRVRSDAPGVAGQLESSATTAGLESWSRTERSENGQRIVVARAISGLVDG